MGIPEVRDEMYVYADDLNRAGRTAEAERIQRWANGLWRRQAVRRSARAQSRRMTPELAEQIRQFAMKHPDMAEDKVGDHFGVNQGRVSEALTGRR